VSGRQVRSSASDAQPAPPTGGLAPYRERLDELDEQIARLFGERFEICREIARYKLAHGIAMMAPERVAEVRARYLADGAAANVPAGFSTDLFELLIGATCRMEDELMAAPPVAFEQARRRVDRLESGKMAQASTDPR
jgi:chorismate mutase